MSDPQLLLVTIRVMVLAARGVTREAAAVGVHQAARGPL